MPSVFRRPWPWVPRRNIRRAGIQALSPAVNLSGVAATTQLNSPSRTITSNPLLTGVSATTSAGIFFRSDTKNLFGVQALTQLNFDVFSAVRNVNLVGLRVTASGFMIGGLAAGGGGGGASGPTGPGRRGTDGSGAGVGGAGGDGDAGVVAGPTTPGQAGNSGIEFDLAHGVGTGGAGASFGDNIGGNGGQYGGGGAGGTGGGHGIGGDGIVFLKYLGDGAIWKTIILNVADNASSPLRMPDDWSNTNFVYLLSSGGCGSNGTHLAGGNGGAGGSLLWGQNVAAFAPAQIINYHIPIGCEVGFLTFGDFSVENGGNATDTASGLAGTHYSSWPGGIFLPSSGGSTGYSGTGIGGAGGGIFAFNYQGTFANPFSVFAQTQIGAFSGAGLPGMRVFLISGIVQRPIPPGIVMLPTSEDLSRIISGPNSYVVGSSQFYGVGEVHWNGVKKTQGTDWQLVSPFSHIIQILNTAGITNPITLIYYKWNIGVRDGFKVNAYPVPFAFNRTSIIAERVPAVNKFFTVEYTTTRPGNNPMTLFARYQTIVDDILDLHTQYDGSVGFQTYRPDGYTVCDLSDNKIWVWSSSAWAILAPLTLNQKFYVKRTRTIYQFNGSSVISLYVAGDGINILYPEVLQYPPYGEGVGKNLLVDAFSPNAAIDFPAAYQIALHPGDYDPWIPG